LNHSKGTTTLASYGLTYDAIDRITKMVSFQDGTSQFTYNDRDELTAATHTGQGNEAYNYDNTGNRTNPGYQSDPFNRLKSDGVYTYTYDAEGNLTQRTRMSNGTTETFGWDYRNRLTRIVTKNRAGAVTKQVDYSYDVYDRRIGKTVDLDGAGTRAATTERYVYDGDNLALVFNGNTLKQRYFYGPGVDQVLAEDNGAAGPTGVRWALADHQGTIRDVTDANGNLLNHIRYDSFGKVVSQSAPTAFFRFGYTGRETDTESGLMYYRARYYDPGVGRFISEDPLGFGGGDSNLYRYVFNNPINNNDPYGNFAIPLGVVAVAGVALVGGVLLYQSQQAINSIDDRSWGGMSRTLSGLAGQAINSVNEADKLAHWLINPSIQGVRDPSLGSNADTPTKPITLPPVIDRIAEAGILGGLGGFGEGRSGLDFGGLTEAFPRDAAQGLIEHCFSIDISSLDPEEIRRIKGIPGNWINKPSKKGEGTEFIQPGNVTTRVRIMPGNIDSPFPAQQVPYVKRQINGQFLDKYGNVVSGRTPEAHIPFDEFQF
jgi:RHS repeat-associated protein